LLRIPKNLDETVINSSITSGGPPRSPFHSTYNHSFLESVSTMTGGAILIGLSFPKHARTAWLLPASRLRAAAAAAAGNASHRVHSSHCGTATAAQPHDPRPTAARGGCKVSSAAACNLVVPTQAALHSHAYAPSAYPQRQPRAAACICTSVDPSASSPLPVRQRRPATEAAPAFDSVQEAVTRAVWNGKGVRSAGARHIHIFVSAWWKSVHRCG
jgi:hypothetical protein